jgi:hypothetical protein
VQAFLAASQVQVLEHPPYSLDLAPADFLLFWRVKEELASIWLTPESLKKTWEEIVRSVGIDKFAAAFRHWLHRCNRCIPLNSEYIEKS